MSVQGSEELFVLNRKLDELIERFRMVSEENAGLRSAYNELRRVLDEKDEKIRELENRNERIKLSGALLGEGESAVEAKRKLNELVREIDRCVALLNR